MQRPTLALISTAFALACGGQPAPSPSDPPPVWTHCAEDEYPVLSCHPSYEEPHQVLSLCEGLLSESPRTSLVVRYGPRDQPVLDYPSTKTPPHQAFSMTTIGHLGPQPEYTLHFEANGTPWRLQEITGGYVSIEKAGDVIGECGWPRQGSLGHISFFDDEGLPI